MGFLENGPPKSARSDLKNFQNLKIKIKLKNDPLKSKNLKKASNHKMSENRPSPNIPTDSKTTIEIVKSQKSNKKLPLKIQKLKISFKSQNFRKLTPQICPF